MAKQDKAGEASKARKWNPLRSSSSDKKRAENFPKTPQTLSPTYRLAYADPDFLLSPELQSVRLQLELMKADMTLAEHNIRSTVVIFGGARIPAPGMEAWAAKNPVQKANLKWASHYYEEARRFARLCSEFSRKSDFSEFVVVTGGGPRLWKRAIRAADVEAPTIGLNIVLPHEQSPNRFVTPELSSTSTTSPSARCISSSGPRPSPCVSWWFRHAGRIVRDPDNDPDGAHGACRSSCSGRLSGARSSTSMRCFDFILFCNNLESLKPIIRSTILLVSCDFTRSWSIVLGDSNASLIAGFVISLKTIR